MRYKNFHAFTVRFNQKINVLFTEVGLSLPYNPQKDRISPPRPVKCKAIWDTGATSSVITEKMIKELGIKPTGKIEVTNTSGTEIKYSYILNIYLPNKVVIPYIKVAECKGLVGDSGFLIGMDVIGAGDFCVTHADGKTTMSYRIPSIKTIDYVEEAGEIKRHRKVFGKIEEQAEKRKKRVSRRLVKKRRAKEKKKKRMAKMKKRK